MNCPILGDGYPWLLTEVPNHEFSKGEWSIYDKLHHNHWADAGEVIEVK